MLIEGVRRFVQEPIRNRGNDGGNNRDFFEVLL
jgi:hypothetical protein